MGNGIKNRNLLCSPIHMIHMKESCPLFEKREKFQCQYLKKKSIETFLHQMKFMLHRLNEIKKSNCMFWWIIDYINNTLNAKHGFDIKIMETIFWLSVWSLLNDMNNRRYLYRDWPKTKQNTYIILFYITQSLDNNVNDFVFRFEWCVFLIAIFFC